MTATEDIQNDEHVMAPASQSIAVTGSGTFTSPHPNATLYVGGAGDVKAKLKRDSAWTVFKAMPVGFQPIRVAAIDTANSTATNMVLVW